MLNRDDALDALREAVRLSPDNLPLRQHLAETLLGLGRYDEAEPEFRHALALSPGNPRLSLGLASTFYQQGKDSHALVIVESLIEGESAPPRAYLLHARLLLRSGEVARAAGQYRRA